LVGFIDESIHPTARTPHWSKEDDWTRTEMIREVRSLPIAARVYGCRFDRPKRKEAARARALTWLVQELPHQVRSVVLAEREANQDRHDRRVLGGLAGRPARFEYGHAAVAKEPLLWVADVVVSSTARALARDEDPGAVNLGGVLSYVGCEPV
jgi:hypothetical protein